MNKYIIILLFIITSCSGNKIEKSHGTSLIDKKSNKLIESQSTRNDILMILGPPSTKSTFNNNIWIYVERKEESMSVFKLGKRKLKKNNVLVVELDDNGILLKKNLFDINKMNDIKFSEQITSSGYQKDTYVYNVLTSLRDKINSPIKRKRSKNN